LLSNKNLFTTYNPVNVMTRNEGADNISLQEPQQSNSGEHELNTSDDTEQAARQRDSDRKRVFALIGSALLQLPIWGTILRIFAFR
jgi:hypothetical protein